MLRIVLLFFGLSMLSISSWAQGTGLPLGNPAYDILDRLEIKTGITPNYHSSLKYFTRGSATAYALSLDTAQIPLSIKDRRDLYYLFRENNEWLGASSEKTTISGERVSATPEQGLTQIEASMENARYILSEKPILKYLYKTPANLFEVNQKYFHLRLNPIVNLKYGGHYTTFF